MGQPKLSIIIPVYNSEKYLKQCLDSVINQSLKDIEIICIDDCSQDNSLSILIDYQKNDSRIIVLKQEKNQGQGTARNKSLEIATGEYVGFVDSDDWIDSAMFEKLYKAAKEYDAEIAHCDYYHVYNGELIPNTTIGYLKNNNIEIKPKTPYNFDNLKEYLFFGITNLPCMRICKLDVIKKNNIRFAQIKYNEDNPLCLEMLILAKKIVYVDEYLYFYRYLDTSCSRMADKPIAEMYSALNNIRLKYFKDSKNVQKAFDNYWVYVFINDYLHYLKNKYDKIRAVLKYQKYFTINQIITLYVRILKNFIFKKISNEFYDIYKIFNYRIKIPVKTLKKYPEVIKNYEQKLSELKKKFISGEKIKVLFLVRENSKWTYDSLYKQMEKSDLYTPCIIVSLLTNVVSGEDKTRNNLQSNYNFFNDLGYNVDYGFDTNENLYIDLEKYKPDIVFYDQMWCLPEIHRPSRVSKYALTYYSSYSYEITDDNENYTQSFHKVLFRYLVENSLNIKRYEKICKNNKRNCVYAGYPKLDTYNEPKQIDAGRIWKEPDKIKIIYAPHHSFEKDELNYATFRENGKFILDYAKNNMQNTTWVFKPHPRFRYALLINDIMSNEEIDRYYEEWNRVGSIYEAGNYFDIFKTSNLLITDSVSFRIEYLPTMKPIICPIKKGSCSMNIIGKKIMNCVYKTRNNKELKQVLDDLIYSKKDYLLRKREKTLNDIMDLKEASSKTILDIIKNDITNQLIYTDSYKN